ncbi:glycosyltransferase family 2 protein [Aestuariivirga litoralis]|uniref:Glycosyltransferase family 2 protein n=1 Tax=Aestuariivirga litoralis TaxID=2650924 RepID=A0A2W2BEE4_9HYPH|nr:glycosyltransferase family 2 protein [Aestuariivirga litoralis]PZF78558.1 glycosyltransferase family 2 protein [Aestuariivirga litoralis]
MSAPVLFVIFNRPHTTTRVFEAIRAARPRRLYVAADGPRRHAAGEGERCDEARRIATAVDWPCELKTLFRDENLGCRQAITEAIDWFFGQEEEGIILEDDTVPHADFFRYCEVLLAHHRHDDKVMAICGGSYFRNRTRGTGAYAFCHTFDPWGWATWASSWRKRQLSFEGLDDGVLEDLAERLGPPVLDVAAYWNRCFGEARDGSVDSWCYYWIWSIFRHRGLVAYPLRNLVSNIGFGPDGTHTQVDYGGVLPWIADLPTHPLPPDIARRTELIADGDLERRLYRNRFSVHPTTFASCLIRSCTRAIRRVTPPALLPHVAQLLGRKTLKRAAHPPASSGR